MGDKQILWACLERLGATDLEDGPDGAVHYRLAGRPGWARWAAGGGLRGWLMIDGLQHVTAEVVINRWLRQQPEPRGCLLEAAPVTTVEDAAWLGAYFERPLDVERISRDDPLQFEVAAFAEAWRLRDFGVRADLPAGGEYAPYNPGAIAPANAWLLVGRPEWAFSWLRISDARQAASKGIHELSWHACRDVQAGDLLFFYSQADKVVRYVARAAGDAFETYVERNAQLHPQWWVRHTPPVPIMHIGLPELHEVAGQIPTGRPRRLQPAAANRLAQLVRARGEIDVAELLWLLQPIPVRARARR